MKWVHESGMPEQFLPSTSTSTTIIFISHDNIASLPPISRPHWQHFPTTVHFHPSSPASSILSIFLEQASPRAFGFFKSAFLSSFIVSLRIIPVFWALVYLCEHFFTYLYTCIFLPLSSLTHPIAIDCRCKTETSKSICISLTNSCVISLSPASLKQLVLCCAVQSLPPDRKVSVLHCLCRQPMDTNSFSSFFRELRNINSFSNEFSQNDGSLMRIW